ncbi:hypothetical protein GCM10010300_58460 [Streptomyces olivaceoviridis]|nr:hypothetical protein GCM10010300_58460 [Streptomyces olivaceoviridis]
MNSSKNAQEKATVGTGSARTNQWDSWIADVPSRFSGTCAKTSVECPSLSSCSAAKAGHYP